jgi:uncharacterized membrane protein YhaH (DUF805 family)
MRTTTQKVAMVFGAVFLLVGVLGLLASRRHDSARSYCRLGAIIYAVLVVMAFISDSTFGLVPIGSHDIWLHAVLAAGLGYLGFVHREAGVRATP